MALQSTEFLYTFSSSISPSFWPNQAIGNKLLNLISPKYTKMIFIDFYVEREYTCFGLASFASLMPGN